MAKKLSKIVSIIPSPFPVVTDYEKEFIREGAEYIADATKEVLTYLKKAGKQNNKNGIQQ